MKPILLQSTAWWCALLAATLPFLLGCQSEAVTIEPMPRTPLIEQADRAVFAHVMVSFRTPPDDGHWRGWNHSNKLVNHDPNQLDEAGRRDIASTYYPSIGPYDMTDPDLVEYHCQLASMAGIDGFMFDLGYFIEPDTGEPTWRVESMRLYREAMARYGLQAVLIYEDKYHWIYNDTISTREAAVAGAVSDMENWLDLFAPIQYTIGRRPLMGLFSYGHQTNEKGEGRLKPAELQTWLQGFPEAERPIVVTQWLREEHFGILNGQFEWMHMIKPPEKHPYRKIGSVAITEDLLQRKRTDAARNIQRGDANFHLPSAWVGFDDKGVMGWGAGRRVTPREHGAQYRATWEAGLASGLPVTQIVTWNDWFEGSNIEPAVEFGTRYLEQTREYTAKWHGRAPAPADFRLPIWIYKIRKSTNDAEHLAAMDRASRALRQGQLADAAELVEPLARQFRVDEAIWWQPPSILNLQSSHAP